MPGLIDAHWHAMLIRPNPAQAIGGDVGFNNLVAAAEASDTLMRGFTTVRDVGGPVFGLKRAIDEGVIEGPRIYPSGAVITVTSGHGDFRQLTDLPRTSTFMGPLSVPFLPSKIRTSSKRTWVTVAGEGCWAKADAWSMSNAAIAARRRTIGASIRFPVSST